MKPLLGKTRINVIRKLIRKLKDAKRAHAKAPDNAKFARQVERFLSHIAYLKVIPDVLYDEFEYMTAVFMNFRK